jgi:hypothetical protein
MTPTVEYVGFRTVDDCRRYHLRVRCADWAHDYTVSIPTALCAPGLARFQDGPELAFQRLRRETSLEAWPGKGTFTVTPEEFEAFREAHRPVAKTRRPAAAAPGAPKIG